MKAIKLVVAVAVTLLCTVSLALANGQEPGDRAGGWAKRTARTPNPDHVVVPEGYKVEVFKAELDTPSAVTVDKDGNVWVNISGDLFGSLDEIEQPHVKVFDKDGNLLKEIGKGTFKSVLNESFYCEENGKTYITEYSDHVWEIDGVDGTPRKILTTLPYGDHRNAGITCRDGYIYYGQGFPTNAGFSDPDAHGWTDVIDPYWEMYGDANMPKTPRDPPCRDLVLTGVNIRDSEGNLTGPFLPKGVAAEPGMKIPKQVPCGGGIHRIPFSAQGSDGMFKHSDMEVYAMGFRYHSGLAFGPKGSRFENALAVTDNGVNDKGNRRVANGAEKLWIVTEKGQDAGFPDKEGMNFVSNKRFGYNSYQGGTVTRPNPQLYVGDKPFVPKLPPYRFIEHNLGVRGVPLLIANPNPDGYINPVLEWDTNNPMTGVSWGTEAFGVKDTLFTTVWGIVDNGPESLIPRWPVIVEVEFLEPTGIKWREFARNIDPGPVAYQKPENRGGFGRLNDVEFSKDGKTMYVADYGEVFVNYQMETPFYTTAKSGAIWKITYTGD